MKDDERDACIRELLDRSRRTETRLMSLGNRLGVDLKDENMIDIDFEKRIIKLKTLDISVSAVQRKAKRFGLNGTVSIEFEGAILSDDFRV